MAEEKKSPKKKREIKDAGERVVLIGVQLDASTVSKVLEAEGREGLADVATDIGNGKAEVWVKLGQVKADTREEALARVITPETVGSFRAPNASAWRGQINRRPPEQVPLDVEITD